VKVLVSVAVKVGVKVRVKVGVAVKVNGVRLKVGDRGVVVRLEVMVGVGVAVGAVGRDLSITATHPRQ
jgi:hypothetical protein